MASWVDGRVAWSGRTAALALGDATMIALFVALGELRHGGTAMAGLETFAQFGLAWLVVGAAAGVYADDAIATRVRAALQGAVAWAAATLLAQLFRLLLLPGARIQPSFVLVSIAVGGLFLAAWRFVAARSVA